MSKTEHPRAMVRVGGVEFDLEAAPADLQRKWQVTQHALEIAKGAQRSALQAQLAAVGKEIAAALAVRKLIELAPRQTGFDALLKRARQ